MLREHLLFMDEVGYSYTIDKKEGYYTFSEILCKKYPGYEPGPTQEIMPVGDTKTVNFQQTWDMLRSTDPTLLANASWMYDGEYRFLDGSSFNIP